MKLTKLNPIFDHEGMHDSLNLDRNQLKSHTNDRVDTTSRSGAGIDKKPKCHSHVTGYV